MVIRTGRVTAVCGFLGVILASSAPAGAAPNACTRNGERTVGVDMKRATNHRGILFAARGGKLRFKMPSGTDACGGAVPKIHRVTVGGRRADDLFSVKGSRRLEAGRLFFTIWLRGGLDSVRLIGGGRSDRITTGIIDTSSFVDFFDWARLGEGRLRYVNRLRMIGRQGGDRLSGLSGQADSGFYSPAARMPLTLVGGPGADQAIGGRRSDRILGQAGNDVLRGGRGDDDIRGGDGEDFCRGGPGTDHITGC
jgi:RTX calcium-binding nonapeptide repeat (4 copies)